MFEKSNQLIGFWGNFQRNLRPWKRLCEFDNFDGFIAVSPFTLRYLRDLLFYKSSLILQNPMQHTIASICDEAWTETIYKCQSRWMQKPARLYKSVRGCEERVSCPTTTRIWFSKQWIDKGCQQWRKICVALSEIVIQHLLTRKSHWKHCCQAQQKKNEYLNPESLSSSGIIPRKH